MQRKKIKFSISALLLAATGVGSFLLIAGYKDTHLLQTADPQSAETIATSQPRSFKFPNGVIISCDAESPDNPGGAAVSFIAQTRQDNHLMTTILSAKGDKESVAVILATQTGFIYRHWPNPNDAHSSAFMVRGNYDPNRGLYKIKAPLPNDNIPIATQWRINVELAWTTCAKSIQPSTDIIYLGSTGAYPMQTLPDIDDKLVTIQTYKIGIQRSDAQDRLGLSRYHIDALTP